MHQDTKWSARDQRQNNMFNNQQPTCGTRTESETFSLANREIRRKSKEDEKAKQINQKWPQSPQDRWNWYFNKSRSTMCGSLATRVPWSDAKRRRWQSASVEICENGVARSSSGTSSGSALPNRPNEHDGSPPGPTPAQKIMKVSETSPRNICSWRNFNLIARVSGWPNMKNFYSLLLFTSRATKWDQVRPYFVINAIAIRLTKISKIVNFKVNYLENDSSEMHPKLTWCKAWYEDWKYNLSNFYVD